jgi:3-dehydroquinate synthase
VNHAERPAWSEAGSISTLSLPPADEATGLATVHVPLPGRAYDILIGRGALARGLDAIAALAPHGRALVVTDANVAAIHLPGLMDGLHQRGLNVSQHVLPPGEATKGWPGLTTTCEAILAARIERRDLVIALGGGVVGDLAGFAAAIVRRGMRFVQVPTSLLAQVDSSVGGKTGINSVHGKNLVGAFHQPSLVIADTAILDTLPAREFRAGYAEVVKYGLINDAPFFDWCEANHAAIVAGGAARDRAVTVSCAAKAAIVVRDEREDGERALLNLGHTFAHALERLTDYDGARLVHGEAVAIGLALAFRFSQAQGLCPGQDAARVAAHLARVGLPTTLAQVPGGLPGADAILDAMYQDKKVASGKLTFILAKGIGRSFIARDIQPETVHAFLESELGTG